MRSAAPVSKTSRPPSPRRPSDARGGRWGLALLLTLALGAGAAEPPPPPAEEPLAALAREVPTVSGYSHLSFAQLAGFKFRPPPQPVPAGGQAPDVLAQVPAAIRRYDGRKVVLTGYLLPLRLEQGLAVEFFFLSSPTLCCYGTVPEVNEWMLVRMRGEGLPPVQDVPVFLAGRLTVKPRWEEGYLHGIYELEGHGLLPLPAGR